MYFGLQKLWQILLAPTKNSSKKILAPADLQEATIRAGLVYRSVNNAIIMMRFVSPKGEYEGQLLLIFCKEIQDAPRDDDSLI